MIGAVRGGIAKGDGVMADIDWDSQSVQDTLRRELKRVLGWLEDDRERCAHKTEAGKRCSRQREWDDEDCIACWQHRRPD